MLWPFLARLDTAKNPPGNSDRLYGGDDISFLEIPSGGVFIWLTQDKVKQDMQTQQSDTVMWDSADVGRAVKLSFLDRGGPVSLLPVILCGTTNTTQTTLVAASGLNSVDIPN